MRTICTIFIKISTTATACIVYARWRFNICWRLSAYFVENVEIVLELMRSALDGDLAGAHCYCKL